MQTPGRTTRTIFRSKRSERGSVMVLTALLLPALVGFAGLGMGGSMVRAASDEAQRTADLAALAAAASIPTLGRPQASGLPAVTEPLAVPLPPAVEYEGNPGAYVSGSIYGYQFAAGGEAEVNAGVDTGVGPIYQPLLGSIGSTWRGGCDVGEAQFAAGRAKMSRNFAARKDASGAPITPRCATGSNTFPPDNPFERMYVRPEFESTGMYRLHLCMLSPADCAALFGQGAAETLKGIGAEFVDAFPIDQSSGCLIDPTGVGCAFNASTADTVFGPAVAASVQQAFRAEFPAVTGIPYNQLPATKASLDNLARLLFAKANVPDLCAVALGPASGQQLCDVGLNLASMLPSTMTPRVRSVVRHNIDVPLVPSWVNGDKPGDFSFTGHALARRVFKNAVVVPTVPAEFDGVSGGASFAGCLPGTALVPGLISSLGFQLSPTIGTLNALLAASITTSQPSNCANAEVDAAAAVDKSFTLDLNPALAAAQRDLVAAASTLNTYGNQAANTMLANALNAQDGRGRTAAQCEASNPPRWCVDLGGQAIEDVKDIYDPPSGDNAPTAQEIVARAYSSGEPITLVALGKRVTVPLGAPVITPGGVITALTYWIPALDFVPAAVQSFDPNNPAASTFKVLDSASATRGLYRAELLDENAAGRLCTVSNDPAGNCVDQPPAVGVLP